MIKIRMRRSTSISENQFGFMLEKSIMKAIQLIRQMMKYYRAINTDRIAQSFIHLENIYYRILFTWNVLWWVITKDIPKKYINIVQDMYREVKTKVKTCGRPKKDLFYHNWPSLRLSSKPFSFRGNTIRDN